MRYTAREFWDIVSGRKPKPPGWDEAFDRVFDPPPRLRSRKPSVSVNSNMLTDAHRLAIAQGQGPGNKFQKMARKRGHTQNAVAKAVGVTPAYFSMCLKGTRALSLARRIKVEEMTGWPRDDWKKTTD